MTDLYDEIQDQKEKVANLKAAFECESNSGQDLTIKYDILILMLQESAKLDRMEDIYLHNDIALDKIAEAIYA